MRETSTRKIIIHSSLSLAQFPSPVHKPFRTDPKTGFPVLEDCLAHSFGSYYLTYAVAEAFQNLYDNKQGIADAFGDFWAVVAARFANNSAVLGYELLNEPWVGDVYADPLLLTLPEHADKKNLVHFYERVAGKLRAKDDQKLLFWEVFFLAAFFLFASASLTSCLHQPFTTDIYPLGFTTGPLGPSYNDRNVMA